MTMITPNKPIIAAKKAYKRPQLKSLGSVRSLTLKLGSSADAFDPSNPTFS